MQIINHSELNHLAISNDDTDIEDEGESSFQDYTLKGIATADMYNL